MSKIKITLGGTNSGGALYKIDTIEHDGKLWLVPEWHDIPAEGVRKPARMIRMDTLQHQVSTGSFGNVDFILNLPLAWELLQFDTPLKPIEGYEVLELPDVAFPIPGRLN